MSKLCTVALAATTCAVLTAALDAGGAAASSATGAAATDTAPGGAGSLNARDKSFLTSNAQTNLAEIAMAKLALARPDAALHNLALTIKNDHEKAQGELETAARSAGFTLPTQPNSTQQAQAADLHKIGSIGFDAAYLQMQADGHVLSIKNTQAEIRSGQNAAVIAYAKTYLPVAQKHLGMVNQAITDGHFAATPVPPPTPIKDSPAPVVTTGPLAHGAKTSSSSDAPWLIALAVILGIVVLGFALGLYRVLGRRNRGQH